MKKLIIPIIICVICLTACEKKGNITPVLTDISYTVEAKLNDETINFDAVIKTKEDNQFEIELCDLSTGIIFNFSNGILTEKLYNLENTSEISSSNSPSIPQLIYEITNDIISNKKIVQTDNKNNFIENKTKNYNYKIYFAESGIPLKITDSVLNTEIIIKNAVLL